MELHEHTALELRDLLACGNVSAHVVAEHFLARIDTANQALGSFTTVTAERALEQAAAADRLFARRHRDDEPLPPLHGMPLAWKDLWDVAGVPTTFGTAAFETSPALENSPLVARLHSDGAVSLGKTQIPEFGLNCYSENLVAPPARNPLDPRLSPGGSSGGSAAAVAAGMLPFAPGNDGGGSIRIPAAACGLLGLKPGLGTVPSDLANGRTDKWGAPRLVVSGPLARTATDAGLLLDSMVGVARPARATGSVRRAVLEGGAGFDGRGGLEGRAGLDAAAGYGSASAAGTVGPYPAAAARACPAGGRPLRIGVSLRSPFESRYPISLGAEAQAALDAGVVLLEAAGHHVEVAAVRYDNRYPDAFQTIWTAGLAEAEIPDDAAGRLAPLTRDFRARAKARPDGDKRAAAAVLQHIAEDSRAQWGQYDAVLTPAMAQTPRPIGYFTAHGADLDYQLQCQYTPFTSMVNVAGVPALVLPTLTTPAGLSMGVQLIGRMDSEAGLLALAAQLMSIDNQT